MDKLNTIPVFGITDKNGNSVALKSPDGTMVNWVFLEKEIAVHMVNTFQEQGGPAMAEAGALEVNDVPLGMLWNSLAHPSDSTQGVQTKSSSGEDVTVELRLLADPTDLAIAKNMSQSMSSTATDEVAQASLNRKLERLDRAWGVVPVFAMAGMKIRVKNSTDQSAPPVELRPWFLSVSSCLESYKKASGLAGDEAALAAEQMSLHMSTLEELVEAMMTESPIDFRNTIFMPSESSIEHMREKVQAMLAARSGASATPSSSVPAPSSGESSMFDDEDD